MTFFLDSFISLILIFFFSSVTSPSESYVNEYFCIKKLVAYTKEEVDFTAAYICYVNMYIFSIKKLVTYTEEMDFTAP